MVLKRGIKKLINLTATSDISKMSLAADYKTKNTKSKICCIGLGPQGLKIAFALVNMGYNVVGVCDLRKKQLRQFNSIFPDIFSTTNISDLGPLNPDVAVAATLADNKLFIIQELAKINIRRILCEKPVVNKMHDLYELHKLVAKEELNLKVNHPKLWAPDHKDVKKIIESKFLGNVERAEIRFKSKGFGNIGCHLLALIFYLLDTKVKYVNEAFFESTDPSLVRSKSHHDLNGRVLFTLENSLELSVSNLNNSQPIVTLFLERGTIEIRIQSNTYHVFDIKNHTENEYSHVYPWGGVSRKYRETFYHLINLAITDLIENKIDNNLIYAGDAVEAIIAAQVSYKTNKRVKLPLDKTTKTPYLFS